MSAIMFRSHNALSADVAHAGLGNGHLSCPDLQTMVITDSHCRGHGLSQHRCSLTIAIAIGIGCRHSQFLRSLARGHQPCDDCPDLR